MLSLPQSPPLGQRDAGQTQIVVSPLKTLLFRSIHADSQELGFPSSLYLKLPLMSLAIVFESCWRYYVACNTVGDLEINVFL